MVAALVFTVVTQPVVSVFHSIEALTVPATCVFTGHIEKLDSKVTVPRGGFRENTTWPDGYVLHTLTVRVDEALKGKPSKSVQLQIETHIPDERWKQWADAKTSFLWFTGPGEFESWSEAKWIVYPRGSETAPSRWTSVRIGDAVPKERTYRGHLALPMFAMDKSVARTREELLKRVREYVGAKHFSPTLHRIELPMTFVRDAGFSIGGPCYLVIPVG